MLAEFSFLTSTGQSASSSQFADGLGSLNGSRNAYWNTDLDIASVTSVHLLSAMGAIQSATSNNTWPGSLNAALSQPLVRASCKRQSVNLSSAARNDYITFDDKYSELNNIITVETLISHLDNSTGNFRFAEEAPKGSNQHSAIFVAGGFNLSEAGDPSSYNVVQACAVDAIWAPATCGYTINSGLYIDDISSLFENTTVLADPSNRITMTPEFVEKTFDAAFPLSKLDWAGVRIAISRRLHSSLPILLAYTMSFTRAPIYSMTWQDAQERSDNEDTNAAVKRYLLESGLDKKFPNAKNIILVEDDLPYAADNASTQQFNSTTYTQVEVTGVSTPYGYSPTQTTVRLSLVVFMAYVMIVVAYLFYTFITGEASNGWHSIGELFILALNSHKPERVFDNTSVGVSTMAPFREPINIQVNDKNSVEVLFSYAQTTERLKYRNVQPNERYK